MHYVPLSVSQEISGRCKYTAKTKILLVSLLQHIQTYSSVWVLNRTIHQHNQIASASELFFALCTVYCYECKQKQAEEFFLLLLNACCCCCLQHA